MKTNLGLVIRERLFEINKETEEGLILMMMTEITKNAREKQVNNTINKVDILSSNLEKVKTEKSTVKEKSIKKKYYVYHSKSIIDWEFTSHSSLEDAIKNAVKYIDAYILYNGKIIKYEVQNNNTAYCYNNNERLLVQLT